eukprot:gene6907-biopygen8383
MHCFDSRNTGKDRSPVQLSIVMILRPNCLYLRLLPRAEAPDRPRLPSLRQQFPVAEPVLFVSQRVGGRVEQPVADRGGFELLRRGRREGGRGGDHPPSQ